MTSAWFPAAPFAPRTQDDLRHLCCALDRQRLLPELLPAPLRGAPHLHGEPAHRALTAPAHLPSSGCLVPLAARLRHPPPPAPRLLRHRAGSAFALVPQGRCADDALDQAPL